MDVYEYRDNHRIITYRRNVEESYVRENGGLPVMLNNDLVGLYLEEGFYVVSIPMVEVKEFSPSYLWFIINSLVFLNDDKTVDELVDFMYLYMVQFSSKNGYEPNKSYLRDLVDKSVERVDEEKCYQMRKFFFLKKLSKKDVRSAVMGFLNKRKKSETMDKIDSVIQWLCIESNKFITAKLISDELGDDLSVHTVRAYMNVFRDEIDTHNRKVFGTDNFMKYKKVLSVHNIKRAINVLNEADERLSRRKVAKETGLHVNTVQNLWDDDEIQEELDKFNEIA